MHLQENSIFDLDLGVKVKVKGQILNFLVNASPGVKVTQNVAQYLLHYVTY